MSTAAVLAALLLPGLAQHFLYHLAGMYDLSCVSIHILKIFSVFFILRDFAQRGV